MEPNFSSFDIDARDLLQLDDIASDFWEGEDLPLDASCDTTLSAIEGMHELEGLELDDVLVQLDHNLTQVQANDETLLLHFDFSQLTQQQQQQTSSEQKKNFCEVCEVQLSSASNFSRHLGSVKHRQRAQPTLDQLTGLDLSDDEEFQNQQEEPQQKPKQKKKSRAEQECKRSSDGKRLFRCEHCPKVFTTVSNLNRHEKLHDNRKLHTCHTCGKRFQQKEYLKKHQIVHERAGWQQQTQQQQQQVVTIKILDFE